MLVVLEVFKVGQYDVNFEYLVKDWVIGYELLVLCDGCFIKVSIYNYNLVGMQGFVFNICCLVFQDCWVCQVISLLFDFEWLNKQLFFSFYKCINSYFENLEMVVYQLFSEVELKIFELLCGKIFDEVFDQVFQNLVNDGSGVICEQWCKVYQLFIEVGYRIENNCMVGFDGQLLSFEFMLFQVNMEWVILLFKCNLVEFGIDMQICCVDVLQFVNCLCLWDFDMILVIWL